MSFHILYETTISTICSSFLDEPGVVLCGYFEGCLMLVICD